MSTAPDFTIGIEEEYLLVDPDTGKLAAAPKGMMEDCAKELEGQFSPEFKACQVEVGTRVSKNAHDAREDLRRLRTCVSQIASNYGLAPIAVSCHPFADWKETGHTDRDRYNDLERALAGVARRMLISGMHVHVGIPREDMRIDLLGQLSYFLPHLLSLSTSSPYWQGEDTGLSSYRLTVFDNLPRTGLPPMLSSWGEFDRIVKTFVDLGIIEDSSKIWWDLRPSSKFPTLEARIFDVTPRMEHTLLLATLYQCLTRMLWRLSRLNQRWRTYDRFLIGENRWRAQRFGAAEGLIDFGRREIVPVPELLSEIQELVAEDAEALGVSDELSRAHELIENGTSAERQRRVYAAAREDGLDHDAALQAIVTHLIEEFTADL